MKCNVFSTKCVEAIFQVVSFFMQDKTKVSFSGGFAPHPQRGAVPPAPPCASLLQITSAQLLRKSLFSCTILFPNLEKEGGLRRRESDNRIRTHSFISSYFERNMVFLFGFVSVFASSHFIYAGLSATPRQRPDYRLGLYEKYCTLTGSCKL